MKQTTPIIRSLYQVPRDKGTITGDEGGAQQHYKNECDINHIMKRYKETGVLKGPEPHGAKPQMPNFMDLSEEISYIDARNAIDEGIKAFGQLDPKIRKRFHQNPEEFLEFMGDKKNLPEAQMLGLIETAEEIEKEVINPPEEAEKDPPEENKEEDK